MRVLTLFAFVMLFSTQAIALPKPTPEQVEMMKICHEDVKNFCDNVVPGEGRLVYCLSKNMSSLENRCASFLDSLLEKISEES